jgi:hypothetical protein
VALDGVRDLDMRATRVLVYSNSYEDVVDCKFPFRLPKYISRPDKRQHLRTSSLSHTQFRASYFRSHHFCHPISATMAALLVLAGAIIHDKVKEKKDMKRRKVLDDERKHRLLIAEANRKEKNVAVHRSYDSEDEKEDEALPRYEDVFENGEGSNSSPGSGGPSEIQDNSESPPAYGRRFVETRRQPGV